METRTEIKSSGMAYVLWFFGGALGLHRYYLRLPGTGALMAFISILGIVFLWAGLMEQFTNTLANLRAGYERERDSGTMTAGWILEGIFLVWWVVDLFIMQYLTDRANGVPEKPATPTKEFSLTKNVPPDWER